jgi:hypothetical protein
MFTFGSLDCGLAKRIERWVCENCCVCVNSGRPVLGLKLLRLIRCEWIDANFVCPHFKQLLMRVRRHSLRSKCRQCFWEVVDIWRAVVSRTLICTLRRCALLLYAPLLFVQLLRAPVFCKKCKFAEPSAVARFGCTASGLAGEISSARKCRCAHTTICLTPHGQLIYAPNWHFLFGEI